MYELNMFKADGELNEFGLGQCLTQKKIPTDVFQTLFVHTGTVMNGIIAVLPFGDGLLQCSFVEDAFNNMIAPCNDMATALSNLYAGFLLISVGYFLVWASTLVIISRLQYYKTYCTDSDRYK